jgi:hypothetical protein
VKCLTYKFDVINDNREDLKLQQAFRIQVVDVFEIATNLFRFNEHLFIGSIPT